MRNLKGLFVLALLFVAAALPGCATAPTVIAKEAATISVPAANPTLLLPCKRPAAWPDGYLATSDETETKLGEEASALKVCAQLHQELIDYYTKTITPLTK